MSKLWIPIERTYRSYITSDSSGNFDLRNTTFIELTAPSCTASTNFIVTAGTIIKVSPTMIGRTIKFTVYPNSKDDSGEFSNVILNKTHVISSDRLIFQVMLAKSASGFTISFSRVSAPPNV